MNPKNWVGDKGYVGNDMITPFKKPAGGELLDWQKEYNTQVSKNWKILSVDYRRPIQTFAVTISAVIGLQFYRAA
jgi:hypothetical protein